MEFKTQAFTISDLYNWHKKDELYLQPKFQRRKVWRPIARSYLIDTIVRGLPMPKIYYRMQVDPNSIKSIREVVDGQQRLDAVFSYIDDNFAVSRTHSSIAAGKKFSKLPDDVRSSILSYDISADLLVGANDTQVLQIFARINSYSVTLNAQEKRNAKYFGRFKDVAYRLGTEHLEFWTRNSILTNQKIARMGEAELTSELLVGLLAGLQDKKASLDRYYKSYEDQFPSEKQVTEKFDRVLNWLQQNLMSELKGTVFTRPALFYSLFMAVGDALYGIDGGSGKLNRFPSKTLSSKQQVNLVAKLKELSNATKVDEPPKKLARFVTASARQTDNVRPRRTRHEYLINIFKSL
ncbi:conserved hypothetical protein [Verrucomicrobiia bacterium DG1235]|nr:conserved hypothetical protein [Verrucomicrobiae bacterium DG1235]